MNPCRLNDNPNTYKGKKAGPFRMSLLNVGRGNYQKLFLTIIMDKLLGS